MANSRLSRPITRLEKVLFIVLAIVLIGTAYYFGVIKNVADTQAANQEALIDTKGNIAVQEEIASRRASMKNRLDELGSLAAVPEVASYDNFNNEIAELNTVLAQALSYDLSFSVPTRSGDTIRRVVDVSYTTENYESALSVIKALENGSYYCRITDFTLDAKLRVDGGIESVSGTVKVTFYETAVGATNLEGIEETKTEEK